jgi:hypothetical protein
MIFVFVDTEGLGATTILFAKQRRSAVGGREAAGRVVGSDGSAESAMPIVMRVGVAIAVAVAIVTWHLVKVPVGRFDRRCGMTFDEISHQNVSGPPPPAPAQTVFEVATSKQQRTSFNPTCISSLSRICEPELSLQIYIYVM